MTAFVWTTVVLYALGVMGSAYHLASRTQPKPRSHGERAVLLVINIAILAWGLRVLGAL